MNLRLYFDEDSSDRALRDALRARGVDVLTAVEASKLEISDEDQLAWATAQGRVLYSFNVSDFSRIHSSIVERQREHGGIILHQIYSVTALTATPEVGSLQARASAVPRSPTPPSRG